MVHGSKDGLRCQVSKANPEPVLKPCWRWIKPFQVASLFIVLLCAYCVLTWGPRGSESVWPLVH